MFFWVTYFLGVLTQDVSGGLLDRSVGSLSLRGLKTSTHTSLSVDLVGVLNVLEKVTTTFLFYL